MERGFALESPDGRLATLPDIWSDTTVRMNDGGCDPDDRFYCGSMAYDERAGAGALYCLSSDGHTEQVLDQVTISNGLDWHPSGARAFYNDTPTRTVWSLDYDRDAGLHNRRPFVTTGPELGWPDGLTVDRDGGVWVASSAAAPCAGSHPRERSTR